MKKLNFLLSVTLIVLSVSCQTTSKEPESIQTLIRQGKTEEAKSYFSTKTDINEQDEDGNTVLHIATLMNDADLVTFLLIKGADTEIKNLENQTPLLIAVERDCFDSARALTTAKADIFIKTEDDKTLIESALKKNNVYYDIMINSTTAQLTDYEGKSIIHYFVLSSDEKALDYAIKKNLPIDKKDSKGVTPLKLALSSPDDSVKALMASQLLIAGAKEVGGETSYFESAVLSRNYSLTLADGQTPLHIAAIKNHKGIAKFLLDNNALTEVKDINGSTPLHEACRYGNVQIAEDIIFAKANVNSEDSLCKTPLLLIIPEESRTEIYKLLITNKANVNHKDMYGDTILHTAAMTALSCDNLELFTAAGADVNIRNKKGNTALATAVEHKLKDQIKFYVKHGADIHAEDASHVTPYKKVLSSNDGLFEAMINSSNINSVDSEGNTPLLIAIQNNASYEKINYLVSLGSNINARNKDGNSALYFAVKDNNQYVGNLLLENNANIFSANTSDVSPLKLALTTPAKEWLINSKTISKTDGSGNTVLHYAAEWKLNDAIVYLIQKGAKIDAQNANGQTPLFYAAKSDEIIIINTLVKSGANTNARDQLGSTPLHVAVRWNALQSANTLINLGLNANLQNVAGKTPLAESAIEGNIEMTTLLLTKGADPNIYDTVGRTALVDAIKGGQTAIVKLLLKNNANPQIQDMNGRTPLHEAVELENIDTINILVNAKSNALNRDKAGNTPLSISFSKSPAIMFAVLGTDKNLTDSDGNSPVHIAVSASANSTIINTLIKKGYPFDTRNSAGFTPLALAVINNQSDSANTLLENKASPFATINSRGDTVATLAFQKKNSEMLGYIVKYSGNNSDIKGNTILHYAAKYSDEATLTRLLSFNLDKYKKNLSGETPYDIAINWKNPALAELLK